MATKDDVEEVDVDVLIVGAGPTGLLLANDIARRGIKSFRIIDGAKGPSKVGIRAAELTFKNGIKQKG
jgi:2-polyprenyl-6-methoxyphenol hydroxylase-like FAD-dependent oxidoreductase